VIVVLMGVSGSGKSAVGRALAGRLGWRFVEGDDFHPPANVEKMRACHPLTDEDRRPWLRALRDHIDAACERGEDLVVACSALKHDYREYLKEDEPGCVRFVYLEGDEALIAGRLRQRKGHFMPPGLLHSQFAALEPPKDALRVSVVPPVEEVAEEVRRRLGL
jgi:gluconokinase